MLWQDKFAFVAVVFLVILIISAVWGGFELEDVAKKQNLRGRNLPPFDFERDWYFWLGGASAVNAGSPLCRDLYSDAVRIFLHPVSDHLVISDF